MIGNYGVSTEHLESDRPNIEGYVVHELCSKPSHWFAERQLEEWLAANVVPGITLVDTHFLTQKIRIHGTMLGVLSFFEEGVEPTFEALREEAKAGLRAE